MNPVIAVDFDGTIVTHRYPEIGTVIDGAFETLKDLKRNGFTLILWTVRDGELLDEAVEFCKQHGLTFYAVNNEHPDEVFNPKYMSRKIVADIYIDDRNVGGFVGWDKIRELLIPQTLSKEEELDDEEYSDDFMPENEPQQKRKWWQRK